MVTRYVLKSSVVTLVTMFVFEAIYDTQVPIDQAEGFLITCFLGTGMGNKLTGCKFIS